MIAVRVWPDAAHLSHRARLVVAADELHAVRPAKLQTCEEGNSLDGEQAAVDVVACVGPSSAFTVRRCSCDSPRKR
jgi:hypothetical protein